MKSGEHFSWSTYLSRWRPPVSWGVWRRTPSSTLTWRKAETSMFSGQIYTQNHRENPRPLRPFTTQYQTSCFHGNAPPPPKEVHRDHKRPVTHNRFRVAVATAPVTLQLRAKDTPTHRPMWPAFEDLIGGGGLRHLAVGCFNKYGS